GGANGAQHSDPGHGRSGTMAMAFASVGVVCGDIGTSPLYALREALTRATEGRPPTDVEVIGVVSLLLWAIVIVVTLKYILFVLRADNRGEGGTLALMALAQRAFGRRSSVIFFLGIAGAALFTGDALVTPAISVLSAVEGLKLVTPALDNYVVGITVVILLTLFMVQRSGTERVAKWFSPIMLFWFLLLAVLGLMHIGDAPRILNALNPVFAINFLISHKLISFIVLGAVFLAVTGTEALYADMGHFGRRPIQYAWFFCVFPSLVLNYMGQGALILVQPDAMANPFFLMAPSWGLLPLVILATLATVIASQAVITGAFSIARQAIQLGLLPRLQIQHTSDWQEGQIFVPRVNRILLLGVIILVVLFRSSTNLASAYGVAVSASMVVDSLLLFFVIWKLWRWPLWGAVAITCLFLTFELAFFASNLLKLFDGGYLPLSIGAAMMVIMWTWHRGTRLLEEKTHRDSIPTANLIRMLEKSKPTRVPGTAIFLTSDPGVAPAALMHNLKHNKVLHERIVLVSVRTEEVPRVSPSARCELSQLSADFTCIKLHYGFMETPRVPVALASLRKSGLKFDIMTTSFFLGRRTLKVSPASGMPKWQDHLYIALSRQAANATDFFAIPSDRVVELGAQVTI
ncbi:MAG: potassium transporter Kup, partial [Nitrospira sp.]|nr:potassium transporter Kup [Nitrospira sp.]